jgi:hypothetical protein
MPGVSAEVMKSDYHKWTAGLSKEQIQQQIDFYKERYQQPKDCYSGEAGLRLVQTPETMTLSLSLL